MTDDPTAGGTPPARRGPPAPQPYIRMVTVPLSGRLFFQCFSTRPHHLWTHWREGREHLCTIEAGRCWCCEALSRPRWNGFVSGRPHNTSGDWVLRVTAGGAHYCPGQPFHEPGPNLRGWWLQLRRTLPRKNGPVEVRTMPPRAPITDLPAPCDLVAYLCRLYGVAALPGPGPVRPRHVDPDDATF